MEVMVVLVGHVSKCRPVFNAIEGPFEMGLSPFDGVVLCVFVLVTHCFRLLCNQCLLLERRRAENDAVTNECTAFNLISCTEEEHDETNLHFNPNSS